MFLTAAAFFIGLACVFGAIVWTVAAWDSIRARHLWHAFWYVQLAAAYLIGAVVTIGRLGGFFDNLPRGFATFILAPILAVPPALQLHARRKARKLIRATRE
jgi:hypothetical protein